MTRSKLLTVLVAAAAAGCGATTPSAKTADDTGEGAASEPPPAMAEDDFLERYAKTMGFRLGVPAQLTVAPGGDSVLLLRSGGESFERHLYEMDTASGQERRLLSAEQLLEQDGAELSDEERARRERLRLAARGITRYELSRDGKRVLVPLSGRLFIYERSSGEISELPNEGGYANAPRLSPDGEKVACVREGDIYVIDIAEGKQRRLTESATEHVQNGLAEFVAQEEMRRMQGLWWSPDGEQLAFQQTDTSEVETLYAADPMHPSEKPNASPYPRAGKTNADVRFGVVSAEGGSPTWVQWDREAYPYLATVRWAEKAPLTILVQNRRQTEEKLLAADPDTGETETIHVERDDAWLNLDQSVPHWLEDGKHFLWSTERNGVWQLELRSRDGEQARMLTSPELHYDELLHVDEEAGFAWITATKEPTETHVWRVPLEPSGGEPVRLTEAPGMHTGAFGKGTDLWVHSAHTLDAGRSVQLRRGREQRLAEVRSEAQQPPFEPNLELMTVGERDWRAMVIRPRNFDPDHRYPVIDSVYGGPHHREVRATRDAYLYQQWVADHGFIVVSIDGRGTPARGREWERAIEGNFIRVPLADQVEALGALGDRLPELDLSRVGIYGWSFGGYFSAMAVMREPELFDAAVAGAPVADWHDYDTHYTERYLGLPDENPEGYRDSSLLTWADRLQRPLLIAHGTSDDNVYFTHAVKLSDALLRAERHHEFLPLSGFTHMVADPAMTRALQGRIVGFLERHVVDAE